MQLIRLIPIALMLLFVWIVINDILVTAIVLGISMYCAFRMYREEEEEYDEEE